MQSQEAELPVAALECGQIQGTDLERRGKSPGFAEWLANWDDTSI